jgi:fermentation-respiration switch protein FrsA (DUF1100 family)
VEDVRNAITWVSNQPEVDPQRIGLWGTSFGGGIVVYSATYDKRVKAVVAQVPWTISPEFRRAADPEGWNRREMFALRDRVERYKTGEVTYLKAVAPGNEPSVMPGQENYEAFMALTESCPNWRNQVTTEILEKNLEFDPVKYVHWIAPSALLLIPGVQDTLIPIQAVRDTFERAREPKALAELPIKHFEIYTEPWFSKAAGGAIDWFSKYL